VREAYRLEQVDTHPGDIWPFTALESTPQTVYDNITILVNLVIQKVYAFLEEIHVEKPSVASILICNKLMERSAGLDIGTQLN
jgi:hypothetical protein